MLQNKGFRWDIQGLRALAVMAVVIFHIAPLRLPGGYLGVDIFFVISGYLIIGFICRDLGNGDFQLKGFYKKRVRRLFPAFFATVVATSIAAFYFFTPEETITFAESAISSLMYVSNIFFYAQSDYFAGELEFAPLLHTWSLSVEEQFYIVFPILLITVFKFNRNLLHPTLILIGIFSFTLSEYLVQVNPSMSFFISPSRFWQFIAGGILAINIHKIDLSKQMSLSVGLVGLLVLLVSLFVYDKHTLFPGINAIIPTVATLLVLLAGAQQTVFSRFMALPINRFLGNISYSFYLWHWPVIVFYKLAIVSDQPGLIHNVVILFISIMLGYLSWKYIEVPFNKVSSKGKKIGDIRTTMACSISLIAVMMLFMTGLPNRFNSQQLYFSSFSNYDASGFRSGKGESQNLGICLLGPLNDGVQYFDKDKCITHTPTKFNILLIGDSHSAQWNSALQENINSKQTVSQVTASGCRPLLAAKGERRCTELMEYGFHYLLKNKRFDRIIIAGRWQNHEYQDLKETLEYLSDYTDDIVVVGRTLEYKLSLPRILATTKLADIKNDTHNRFSELKELDEQFKRVSSNKNVSYVSLIDTICPIENNMCSALTVEDVPMAFDYGHFTHEGALEIISRHNDVFIGNTM